MSSEYRIGLLGGSFNPFHNGHLAIANSVISSKLVNELWLLVTPCNPWKKDRTLLPDELRLRMVTEAVKAMPKIKASDYEFSMPMPSYTSDTLMKITKDYPQYQFVLIIGADNWTEFYRWNQYQYILDNYEIIVYPRSGYPINRVPKGITLLNYPLVEISSTKIVSMIKNGEPIDELVPNAVAEIIKKENLFKD